MRTLHSIDNGQPLFRTRRHEVRHRALPRVHGAAWGINFPSIGFERIKFPSHLLCSATNYCSAPRISSVFVQLLQRVTNLDLCLFELLSKDTSQFVIWPQQQVSMTSNLMTVGSLFSLRITLDHGSLVTDFCSLI